MTDNEDIAIEVGRNVDSLINVDVKAGVENVRFYEAARKKTKQSLTYLAAKLLLENVHPEEAVVLSTGFIWKPGISQKICDTDGPLGCAVLAKAISIGLRAVPVIFCEDEYISILSKTCWAAGLPVLSLKEAKDLIAQDVRRPFYSVVVSTFPKDIGRAEEESERIIKELRPSVMISVGRKGVNEKGVYHNYSGEDVSAWVAKIDHLFGYASSRGVPTIGVGDGGVEIGFGNIIETVKAILPFGSKCKCPCGAGIACSTKTDAFVVAALTNWGAYGVTACLATLLEMPGLLHTEEVEKRISAACAMAGGMQVHAGLCEPGADGLSPTINSHLTEILRMLVMKWLEKKKYGRTLDYMARRI